MAIYADYTYYTGTYKGTAIVEAEFDRLAARASAQIDLLTFRRAAPVIEAGTDTANIEYIKMATCAVAETLKTIEAGPEVQSERVGDQSVTYNIRPRTEQQKITSAAKLYLGLTDLMFRGLDE